jgi:hypothetical protein
LITGLGSAAGDNNRRGAKFVKNFDFTRNLSLDKNPDACERSHEEHAIVIGRRPV